MHNSWLRPPQSLTDQLLPIPLLWLVLKHILWHFAIVRQNMSRSLFRSKTFLFEVDNFLVARQNEQMGLRDIPVEVLWLELYGRYSVSRDPVSRDATCWNCCCIRVLPLWVLILDCCLKLFELQIVHYKCI